MTLDATALRYGVHDIGAAAVATAAVSDVGTVRSENQDRCAWTLTPGGIAVILADGMGGGIGGAEAAAAAVDAVVPALAAGAPVEQAVGDAVRAVATVRNDLGGGMVGTTLVIAVCTADSVVVANVGDSRAYVCGADGGIRRITNDHSRAGELVTSGALTEEEARHDGRRNMLTRAVNGDAVMPDIFHLGWRGGDTIALCSDGVWEPVADSLLVRDWGAGDLGAGVLASCRGALEAGSRDNVTVIAARLA